MITPNETPQHFTLPQTWNDMTVRQQMEAYNIIMATSGEVFEARELVPAKRILLFKTLSGITEQQLEAWKKDCIDANEDQDLGELVFLSELDEALSSTNFLFEINENTPDDNGQESHTVSERAYSLALTLTRCPFPQLDLPKPKKRKKHKARCYLAPADGLSNISFLELCVSFQLFEQYTQDQKEDTADELLATIYREPKPATKHNKRTGYHGDKRQPYLGLEALVPQRKKKITKLQKEVKQLLLFWFACCRQEIINSFPDLFSQDSSRSTPSKYGWGATLMAMAGGLPQIDAVSAQPAEDALAYLDYLNEQAKKAEMDAAFQKT